MITRRGFIGRLLAALAIAPAAPAIAEAAASYVTPEQCDAYTELALCEPFSTEFAGAPYPMPADISVGIQEAARRLAEDIDCGIIERYMRGELR